MTNAPHTFQAVELADEFTAELEAGTAVAAAFYAGGRRTLVATMLTSDVVQWDGSEERALVYDPDGIELADDFACDKAA